MKNTFGLLGLCLLIGAGCNAQSLKIGSNTSSTATLPADKILLFVGQGCSHCQAVEDRLKTDYRNISVETKEVFKDKANAALLIQAIKVCGLPLESTGVPLLWDGQRCHAGDERALRYLKDYKENFSK